MSFEHSEGSSATPSWTYVGKANAARLATLQTPMPFAEVVDRVLGAMTVVCFHREPRQRDLAFNRAALCVVIGPDLFDLFFNSQSGYRGAFFASPENGTAANALLLNRLAPSLVCWATGTADRDEAARSLALPSAKAWLAEDQVALCEHCAGDWSASYVSDVTIENGRWERGDHPHARWGRQAPCFTKLRIFGGFLNAHGDEWLADHKKDRACNIWAQGWS